MALTRREAYGEGAMRPDPFVRCLTPREQDVALLVAQGLRDAAIGERLGLTVSTVGTNVQRIQRRLHLTGRKAIVAWVAAGQAPGNPAAGLRSNRVR